MGILLAKFKETLLSVVPVMTLVILLHLTVLPLPMDSFWRFIIGSMAIILGLTIFLFGVDIAISPVGSGIGSAFARKKSLTLLVLAGFVLGFFINIAEPDLFVLAEQISSATKSMLSTYEILVVVSLGIGFMVAIGLLRIVFQVQLRLILFVIYGIILILSILAPNDFLGIAFDSGGVASGPMTATFVLSFVQGIAISQTGDVIVAFGTIAMVALTPLITLQLLGIIYHRREKRGERLG